MGLAEGQRGRLPGRKVAVVGEAKFTTKAVGVDQLARLERAAQLIAALRHHTDDARLTLFSRAGFTPELIAEQRRRTDVVLVGLDQIFAAGEVRA